MYEGYKKLFILTSQIHFILFTLRLGQGVPENTTFQKCKFKGPNTILHNLSDVITRCPWCNRKPLFQEVS